MPATIKDVARAAGCSIKTVSRVINNEPYVTEETRTRVLTAVRAVGYAPNISARRLVTNKSFMLCILMYPGYYPSTSSILSRIMDIGYEENYDILIQPYFPRHNKSKQKLVNLINERRIDGFVTTPPCDADDFVIDLLNTYKVPFVQINPFDRDQSVPYVAGDDYQGALAIIRHILSLGHRRIAFLMGPRNMRASFDRLRGYQDGLNNAGEVVRPDWIKDSEFTFDGGYTAAKLLMEQSPQPTCIFAGNDEAAFGVLFALQELGISVPAQVSVCGYDDLEYAKNIWPSLTTVHQPAEEMVEMATRILIQLLKGKPVDPPQLTFPAHLVIRKSTAPPPQK